MSIVRVCILGVLLIASCGALAQDDSTKVIYSGFLQEDGITPIDRVINAGIGPEEYFSVAGEILYPVIVVRNDSSTPRATTVHCQIYEWSLGVPVYDVLLPILIDPQQDKTVVFPPWIDVFPGAERLESIAEEKLFSASMRKGEGEPVELKPLRKGHCGFVRLKVTENPDGSFHISKIVINKKDHDCPWELTIAWAPYGANAEPDNVINSTSGSEPSGSQPDTVGVDWTPPGPGRYCIVAQLTIQGRTIREWYNNVRVHEPPAPPPPPAGAPPPPPPPPPGWGPLPPGKWWHVAIPVHPRIPTCPDSVSVHLAALGLGGLGWPYILSADSIYMKCPPETTYAFLSVHVPDGASPTDSSVYTVIADTGGIELGSLTFVLRQSAISLAVDVNERWNMVSVPLIVDDFAKIALFPTSLTPAFEYAGSYFTSDTLENGTAYWLKFGASEKITLTGMEIDEDSVHVNAGWNMIGTISHDVAVGSITSSPPGMTVSNFFGYDGAYSVVDTLVPGKGYWVNVDQEGQLILASSALTWGANAVTIKPDFAMPPPPPDGKGVSNTVPENFALDQNHPNPFNPTTTIRYQLPEKSFAIIRIYNVLGREIKMLVNEVQDAGRKSVEWDAGSVASGVYFYRLDAVSVSDPATSFMQVKKMVLIK